jgi:uncharacterized linocin/CFP29 family protein
MNHLLRDLAPLSPEAWAMVDDEAKARLTVALGARKLVDFTGPLGWTHSATPLGRVGPAEASPTEGVLVRSRRVIPLAEVRADFTLSLEELVGASRGAADVDFTPLDAAAQRIARLENAAVFDGLASAGFTGIIEASPHDPVPTGDDPSRLALRTAAAIAVLKQAGIGGPYGMALDYDTWVNVHGGSDSGGAPLATHLQRLLQGPTEWTPGISRPVVVSLRGGDFLFESGEDLSVGYTSRTGDQVELYLEETFSFRVATPEAAVSLA